MYATVKFGSITKGTMDKYSDIDLLIVCPDKQRKSIHEKYKHTRYNISFFSNKQLFLMRDKGSLFLQHIKRDGVVLHDEGNALSSFLNSCQFMSPDSHEIKRCESTLIFINSLPDDVALLTWKADFFYCVTRDFLIKKLAVEGVLAFNIDEIIDLSSIYFDFKKNDFDKFKKLRRVKAINREGGRCEFSSDDVSFMIHEWFNILSVKFNLISIDTSMRLIDCLFKREHNSTYEALRCLEALYILIEKNGINHIEHNKIMNYIKSPNFYRSLQNSKKMIIRRYLNEIYSFIETKNNFIDGVTCESY
ncbi:nucleotidyltransferase domain-containing protein [Pantoea ananatis]|uniref:nucleotidyltransferase domain-containing protein n=1 Tax=Pantoea ananas TaxID=553 RepID=UPI0002323064|nr:nucleotidyltransferase domain-containing protein [Pantoea ananatis]AER33421.1 hypothetical protein PAGR_g2924 [Pantoea ananatis PA13]